MTVEKISAWIPVSDEMLVDYGIGTPEQLAESVARLKADRQESDRLWNALPWYVRLDRTIRFKAWSAQDRIDRWIHRDCDR